MNTTLLGLVIGLLSGVFGGIVGLGGGVVMVPLLTGWAGLRQHAAHATSLVAVVATGLTGAIAYATGGAVAWREALLIAAASTVASSLSAAFSGRVPAARLRQMFAVLLIVVAVLLPFGARLTHAAVEGAWLVPAGLLVGAVAGVLAGLLGVGGGSVVVPLLILVFGFDQHLAQGTSLAVMIPAGLAGSLVHLRRGHIATRLVPGLVLGTAIGAFVGGRTALGIPELPLQLFFAALLIWTGIRYLRSERGGRAGRGRSADAGKRAGD